MLEHADVWRAIDLLAERNGLSVSGLARKAGLSPTLFNPSKRIQGGRQRWPSTESISLILNATKTEIGDFIALAQQRGLAFQTVPLLSVAKASEAAYFDAAGLPLFKFWERAEVGSGSFSDPQLFLLEVDSEAYLPFFQPGDRLIVAPSADLRRGDKVIFRTYEGKVLVKKILRMTATRIEVEGLSGENGDEAIERSTLLWVYRLVGVSF